MKFNFMWLLQGIIYLGYYVFVLAAKFIHFKIYSDAHNQKSCYWIELHSRVEILYIVKQIDYTLYKL